MGQLANGKPSYLVNDGGLQVHEDSPGHVLAGAGLREEGVEGVITASNSLVRGHLMKKSLKPSSFTYAIRCSKCLI